MKKIKELVQSGWFIAACTVIGPVAVCVSSIIRALLNGYSCERPLWSLLVIILMTMVMYLPVVKAGGIEAYNRRNDWGFSTTVVYGGFALCFIAVGPELEQCKEFSYTNHIMVGLFYVWVTLFFLFWAYVILVFGLGWEPKSD